MNQVYERKLRPTEANRHFITIESKYRKLFPLPKKKFRVRIDHREFEVSLDKQWRIWAGAFYRHLSFFEEGVLISISEESKGIFNVRTKKS